ncbi:DUF523 domain-containing protein [Thiotrichales bacterium 19S3-7]|nr:DUF523 domain-containing protein [Thiotrichales bacterium 19S3-7]MCF6801141.1 DUF523 domain-containing protein [Thiotrichales bacterium 19S3-11]
MKVSKKKLLISSCLMGNKVRYDGSGQLIDQLEQLKKQFELIVICPEVAGGMSTPRAAAEIVLDLNDGLPIVKDCQGEDVTEFYLKGAKKALALCQKHHIRYALLKERSPSCGSRYIYDGHFKGKIINGDGITARLLKEHGIKVYSEETIDELFRNS